jgi:glycosyltransferase involved in cell wall biosynthesis
MVRTLGELGYESVVVTSGGATADRWAPEDATLAAELPPGLEVLRLPKDEEPEPSARQVFAERWLRRRGPWEAWWISGSYSLSLEAASAVDLIYVWMQPYTSAEVGAALSKKLSRPWVADLGDPWALDEMMVYASGVHRRLELRRMGNLLASSAAIVMSTPEAVRRLLHEFPELADRPVVAIPNGFDADDFAGPIALRNDGKFRVVHTGYLHTALGEQHRRRRIVRRLLRGGVEGLDILTRSHVYLVDAINQILAREPELTDVLEFHLAGVMSEADRAIAMRTPVTTIHGYVTHAASIELIRTADLLFLPMQNLPRGVRATIVPGKTYEYLASGTPILGAVPEGDARDILAAAGNTIIVDPDDTNGMSACIRQELERFRAGIPSSTPDPQVLARFEYRKLAADLASVFEAVLSASR